MRENVMKTVAILIPALNPDRRLIASFGGEETDITILEHAVNLGKGRALKDSIILRM